MKMVRHILAAVMILSGVAFAQTPEEKLKSAQQLERDGAPQRAAKVYSEFLTAHPDHSQVTEVRYRLGKCYDALGMVEEAVASLKLATNGEKKPGFRNRPDALYALGKLYASNRQYDLAIPVLEKMLSEGAGLDEAEVLNLLGGYYAIQGKFDLAAAKFNILRRKNAGAASEQAAYKLAMLWLRAEKLEQAVQAIGDLATGYPTNQQIPDLMLRAADAYRQKKEFDKTIALCEQLRKVYGRAPEALGANYLLALCCRDKGEFQKAADALDSLAGSKEFASRGMAAEAALQSAELYFKDLKNADSAMQRYEDAARLARASEGDRRNEILEQCYFRLGEHHFRKKNYGAALDFYTLMRSLGTRVNILGRILECQAQLNKSTDTVSPETINETDIELLRKKIAERPGTIEAAEAEIFLLDRQFTQASKARQGDASALGPQYEKLMGSYPKEILANQSMGAYAWHMAGLCYASGSTREQMNKAVAAFEKCVAADDSASNPYREPSLENLALCAERAGDKIRANKAYAQLLEISKQRLAAVGEDKNAEKKTLDYLKSLATRADTPELLDSTIAMTRDMIEKRGPLSDLSRESRFYLGELYFLKKDYSNAAKTFREFVQIYGPRQDAAGDVANGPWKPGKNDEKAQQVFEAAIRICHAWYLQGHDQNLVATYQWIVRNFPHDNKHMAEAQYALGMELLKGQEGQKPSQKKIAAETLWKTVIAPSLPLLDQDEAKARKEYYSWAGDEDAQRYFKAAMMKAGQLFSEIDDHETAAAAFKQFLGFFGSGTSGDRKPKRGPKNVERDGDRDEMLDIARYALGREYIAMGRIGRMIEVFKPYLTGHRDDRFRLSGLRLLGHHAGREGMLSDAIEAYATILDEYGDNRTDSQGRAIPVAAADRLRGGAKQWDGIRQPWPAGVDPGDVRYALGFLYWKNEEFPRCAKTLLPFVSDAKLKASKLRPQALFMAGQSSFKNFDYIAGTPCFRAIVREHPKFEAIEEVYVWAADGCARSSAWADLELLCANFLSEWPRSDRRSRMELYNAVAKAGKGKTDDARRLLDNLARSDTYEDVKADANFHLGLLASNPTEAMPFLEKSIAWPRDVSLLEAGRCAIKLSRWDQARQHLEKCISLKGDSRIAAQAKDLLAKIPKQTKQP